jgi:hypothetical protein
MKLNNLITSFTSDSLLLESVADYFSSLVENSNEVLSVMSDVMEHAGDSNWEIPDVSNLATSTVINGKLIPIDVNTLLHNMRDDIHEYEEVFDGNTYTITVDDVIDQLGGSIKSNRVIVEAMNVLSNCPDGSYSEILGAFTDAIALNVGEINDDMQSVAMSIARTVTKKGMSVGDRVRAILEFIGIYNIDSEADDPDIGIPDSELTDITGTNIITAWFNAFPETLREVGAWIKDTAEKLLHLLRGIVQTFVGSSVYRSITKFVTTMLGQSDSFSFVSGAEDGLSIGNYGRYWRLISSDFDTPWVHDNSTIHGVLSTILNAAYPDTHHDYSLWTITQIANEILDVISTPDYYQQTTPLGRTIKAERAAWPKLVGSWADVYYDGEYKDTLLGLAYRIYRKIAFRRYGFAGLSKPDDFSILTLLNYALGAILDEIHLNDVKGYTDKVVSNNYLKIDLPGSVLYFWLVGADIYCTRRVIPIGYYSNFDSYNAIYSDLKTRFGWVQSGSTWDPWGIFTQTFHPEKCRSMMDFLRSTNDIYIDSDKKMMKAVFAAHVLDSMYLSVINQYMTDPSFDPNEDLPSITQYSLNNGESKAFEFLTGVSRKAWLDAYGSLDDNFKITNLTLAKAIGCAGSTVDVKTQVSEAKFLLNLLLLCTRSDQFIPYVHTGVIAVGRYRIATDSELANIFTKVIEVTIIIFSTLALFKLMGKLKRKARYLRTKADATAWTQVLVGTYTKADAALQNKLHRRARLCEKISQAMFGAIGKAVESVKTTTMSAVASMKNSLSSSIAGSDSFSDNYTLRQIKTSITG